METNLETKTEPRNLLKEVLVFLGLTLAGSATFYALILRAGSLGAQGGLYVLGLMWTPGLAGILSSLIFKKFRKLGWKPGRARYLGIAYVLPILYALPVYALVWVTGLGGFIAENAPSALGLLSFGVIYVLIGLLSALGEEIGWRGFLVPRLTQLMGYTKGALLGGAIWTAWHAPLILFSDYNSGGSPEWYALLCFTVLVMGISFAFAWLRLASGSLWPAALLHAAHNAYIQGLFDPLTRDTGNTLYITGEFGAGLALTGLIVGIIFWQLGRKQKWPQV